MGLLSSLFKKKIKKIDVESFTPYVNTSRVYVRGVDEVIISIPYDKNVVQGAVILIWQPKNHSFLHIVYDVKTNEKSVKYHDGLHNISPGPIDITINDVVDKIIITWEISDTWALDNHFVESYLFLGDMIAQYESKTITIIENQSRTLSEESEEKIRKMIEKQQKNMSSATVFNT